jgi:MATE family multidrug resistance protein
VASVASALMLILSLFAEPIFALVAHSPALRSYETTFFTIMCMGSWPLFVGTVLACFFTGRGRTWTVFWVDLGSCAANIVLDYAMIFGRLGFPRWGVAGAAWATVMAEAVRVIVYAVMFLNSSNSRTYGTRHAWRFEWELIKRMLRYGLPNGVQFALDVVAFAFFLAVVGRMGEGAMGATSVVFQINQLAFMPMVGMGTAVSVIVGRNLGADRPESASRCTWIAGAMCFTYMALVSLAYVTIPGVLLFPFAKYADAAEFAAVGQLAARLLWFVAFYSLFDTGNIIFSATLKGAGDTRFVMLMSIGLSWVLFVIPSYLVVKFGWGLYTAWGFATAYVSVLALVFLGRVMQGKWKSMRVIEKVTPLVAPAKIQMPTGELDPH